MVRRVIRALFWSTMGSLIAFWVVYILGFLLLNPTSPIFYTNYNLSNFVILVFATIVILAVLDGLYETYPWLAIKAWLEIKEKLANKEKNINHNYGLFHRVIKGIFWSVTGCLIAFWVLIVLEFLFINPNFFRSLNFNLFGLSSFVILVFAPLVILAVLMGIYRTYPWLAKKEKTIDLVRKALLWPVPDWANKNRKNEKRVYIIPVIIISLYLIIASIWVTLDSAMAIISTRANAAYWDFMPGYSDYLIHSFSDQMFRSIVFTLVGMGILYFFSEMTVTT